MITSEEVREIFEYKDGMLFWKMSPHQKIKVGERAGSIGGTGYRKIQLFKKTYKEHRLVWLWHYPLNDDEILDHIDRDKTNNKIENLRVLSQSENNRNSERCNNSITGIQKFHNKWKAFYWHNRKNHYLGHFETLEDAQEARVNFASNCR